MQSTVLGSLSLSLPAAASTPCGCISPPIPQESHYPGQGNHAPSREATLPAAKGGRGGGALLPGMQLQGLGGPQRGEALCPLQGRRSCSKHPPRSAARSGLTSTQA